MGQPTFFACANDVSASAPFRFIGHCVNENQPDIYVVPHQIVMGKYRLWHAHRGVGGDGSVIFYHTRRNGHVLSQINLDDSVHPLPVRNIHDSIGGVFSAVVDDVIRSGPPSGLGLLIGADRSDYGGRAGPFGELNAIISYCPGGARHENSHSRNGAVSKEGPVSRHRRNSEAGPLGETHRIGKGNRRISGQRYVLGRRSEGTLPLPVESPHSLAHP